MRLTPPLVILTLLTGTALAHSGVQNAAVKARMDLMVEIKDATAVLGGMARGNTAFDAAQAEAARAALETHAAKIPALFESPASDPMDEARPDIWTDWDGFLAASAAMENAAAAMDTTRLESLRAGMGPLGQSCSDCHKDYRVEK